MNQNIILNNIDIEHITKRIAFQIFETFVDEQSIIIAGISENGFVFAQKIADYLTSISEIRVEMCEVFMDKNNPSFPITTSLQKEQYKNKGLVLVDDVLNSGTTLVYGVRHFLDFPLKKFKTAVLIDRNHKKYPVKADFKGISLSTSLLEHVTVVFENNNDHAVLS